MPVMDEIREQQRIVRQKGLRYRLKYFWDYYKTATIFTILGILALSSLIYSVVTAKNTRFEAILINAVNAPDPRAFEKMIDINTRKEEAVFDYNYYINPDPEKIDNLTYTNSQKIMAVIASKAADVMIAPEGIFDRYANGSVFADLRNVFGEEELAALGDRVLWLEVYSSDTDEILPAAPLAIDISDAPGMTGNLCYDTDEKILMGAVINSGHPEDIVRFYNFLYSSESSSTE